MTKRWAKFPLEVRCKHVNYVGNVIDEFLKRWCDEKTILEAYIEGRLSLHAHGITRWPSGEIKQSCLTFTAQLTNAEFSILLDIEDLISHDGQSSVLIRVGEVPECAHPVASIVRLEEFDTCLVSEGNPSEMAAGVGSELLLDNYMLLPTNSPSSFSVFSRKLRSILDLTRVQDGEFVNKIIKSRPQVVYGLAQQNTEFGGKVASANYNLGTAKGDLIYWTGMAPEGRNFSLEIRQMLLCPSYSRISIVKGWLDAIGLSHGQETSNTGKTPTGLEIPILIREDFFKMSF